MYIIYWIIGIVAVVAVYFLLILPLTKKLEGRIYKNSNKKNQINIEDMGPEIVRKEKPKEK